MTDSTSSTETVPRAVAENGVREVRLLASTDDDYNGVMVEMDEPMDPAIFVPILRASISHWRLLGKKTVWIKLPIHQACLVEPLVKEGFRYHHAEPEYLMLVYWLPETASNIPANATHRVCVGGFVMNEKREILVVQEKSGPFWIPGVWKFPTGSVDQGEDICAAVIREVKEETGVSILIMVPINCRRSKLYTHTHTHICLSFCAFLNLQIDTKFLEVLALRQTPKSYLITKSELFILCMLRPLSFDIQVQEQEIGAAQWMPFEEYAAQRFNEEHKFVKQMDEVCRAKMRGHYSGFNVVPSSSPFPDRKSFMYLTSNVKKKKKKKKKKMIHPKC
ncbi:nudix hydrolase 2 isoform X1 [Neltuma alba]|uniref:nudix hydrolase 2 isoform X1 n=1 Tax=Neltuma alba TaxID=207710 RepID=UPI0010A33AF6|nr:nudix hydrolase 2-like isoform X1 [Prosopis alba]